MLHNIYVLPGSYIYLYFLKYKKKIQITHTHTLNLVAMFLNSASLGSNAFLFLKEEEFSPREDFSDADQLRVGNDGIFMLAFFST